MTWVILTVICINTRNCSCSLLRSHCVHCSAEFVAMINDFLCIQIVRYVNKRYTFLCSLLLLLLLLDNFSKRKNEIMFKKAVIELTHTLMFVLFFFFSWNQIKQNALCTDKSVDNGIAQLWIWAQNLKRWHFSQYELADHIFRWKVLRWPYR